MKTRIIRGILVDVNAKTIKAHDLEYHGLDDISCLLKCDILAVVTRFIGNKTFDIYLDDSGLLKENTAACITDDCSEMLVGNIFICHHDRDGEITSLSDLEIDYILERKIMVTDTRKHISYEVIMHSARAR